MSRISEEEESLLLVSLKRGYLRSGFWRKKFSDLNIQESDFVRGFPFDSLPFLTKGEILEDQAKSPPFGDLISVDPTRITRIHKTSGTTTTPFFVALTERDVQDTYVPAKRAYQHAGMSESDRVVHCLNFNMWSGGVSDYIPIELVGAAGIPYGVGNTDLLLDVIRRLGANAISSTPSYMFAIRDRCLQIGIDPKELGLTRGYFGGEGLLQVPGVRQEIESTFGMTAIDANYGMSEICSVICGEGQEKDGLVYHCYGILYVEMVDENQRPVPIETGAKGELVFSTLRREAQPLFRYRTNDLAEIIWADTGDDGLRRLKLRIIGRSDDMLVIRGVNFFPQSLLTIIGEFEPSIGRNFRVVRPGSNDPGLTVVLETPLQNETEKSAVAEKFRARVSAFLQVRVNILWVQPGAIPVSGNKLKVLIDDLDDIPTLKNA